MNRSKIVAIITGAISILLAIAYLLIVQLLDFRGEMLPAPVSQLPLRLEVARFTPDGVGVITAPQLPSTNQHYLG
ncbi:MAG TPA: hypothetical protein V6C85_14590 [Allocoleopsis sp.]